MQTDGNHEYEWVVLLDSRIMKEGNAASSFSLHGHSPAHPLL
jgi:hypothetical protein